MQNNTPQRPANNKTISSGILSYIVRKNGGQPAPEKNMDEERRYYQSQPAHIKPAQPPARPVQQNKNANIRLVNDVSKKKTFEFQIMFGELENLLLHMNRNDAAVQRALVKLNDIRTRVFQELDKVQKIEDVVKGTRG